MGVQNKIVTRSFIDAALDIKGKTGALALGVPGTIFDASPARIHTEELTTAADFGTAVSGKGILVSPREAALVGIDGDPLAPSLTLAKGDAASFMTFGHVIVRGDKVSSFSSVVTGKVIVGSDWWTKRVAVSTDKCVAIPETADAFSVSKDYALGDFVTYTDGKVYMFKATHAAGAWSSSDVVDTSATTTTEWPGEDATVGNLYKFWGDTCVVYEVNGLA